MLDFRAEAVLDLLVASGLALPPTPIYENLRLNGETFSKRTVHRKLGTLVEEGYAEKVLDGQGYYRATEAGRELVEAGTRAGREVTVHGHGGDTVGRNGR